MSYAFGDFGSSFMECHSVWVSKRARRHSIAGQRKRCLQMVFESMGEEYSDQVSIDVTGDDLQVSTYGQNIWNDDRLTYPVATPRSTYRPFDNHIIALSVLINHDQLSSLKCFYDHFNILYSLLQGCGETAGLHSTPQASTCHVLSYFLATS